MGRLTADAATRQIKKALDNRMTLVLDSKNSDRVDYTITYTKNNAQIKAFFDLSSQLYGFVMFNNGIKTYDKVDVFLEMLTVYMYINTELIPITQQIVELYSREMGLTTRYITFTGNMTEGFTTQFEVAGEARFVFVTEQETNVYRLTLVESFDKKKYKTLDMYLYIRHEDGTYEKRFMILSAANKLFERCMDMGEDYKLQRTDTNSFTFEFGDLIVEFSLNIGERIEYVVTKVNGEDKDFSFILDDFLDIDSFIAAVLDRAGGRLGNISATQGPKMPTYDDAESTSDIDAVPVDDIGFEDSEESIDKELNELDQEIDQSDDIEDEGKVEEEEDSDDLFDFTEETNDQIEEHVDETEEQSEETEEQVEEIDETNEEEITEETNEEEIVEESIEEETTEEEITEEQTEESSDEEISSEETVEETEEQSEETEENNEIEESQEEKEQVADMAEQEKATETIVNDTDDVTISKLMNGDEVAGLMFNVNGALYTADIESLKEFKIPYKRLSNVEKAVQKKGYTLWESESKFKTFADDISDDKEKIKQFYDLMF